MSSTPANNASALTTPSTLRPRTKRLISGLSEGDESAPDSFDSPPRRIASPAPSPFDSRSASPIPQAHPQRSSLSRTRESEGRYAGNGSWGRRAQVGGQRKGGGLESPTSLAGLWGSSWSTLQGFATDFLNNDIGTGNGSLKAKSPKKPLGLGSKLRASSASSDWGPSAPTSQPAIGSGTREARENALRAQKRKDMLTRQDSSYADALGKFKRRLSDDHNESASAPPGEHDDRAALVYVHHVKKDDTLAGITIKYNCAAAVVRKANRMWPNDTVQIRQSIVLPVDACGVKGKPVAGPEPTSAVDLLGAGGGQDEIAAEEVETPKATSTPSLPNGDSAIDTLSRNRGLSLSTNTTSLAGDPNAAGEPPWTHDSWVLLPNSTNPTEIARLSRRALGYFPPARRKSLSFSDLDTPSTSLDLPRPSISDSVPQRPRRPRRLSNANNGYFPSYLAGPGGVGTMSKSVHFPGPAQDGLNKMFAKHLPDVAPPRNQVDLYQPELPLYHDDETPQISGNVTPSLLLNHSGNGNLNLHLENVGGAIESWVRRLATKTLTPGESGSQAKGLGKGQVGPRTSVGAPGRGRDGVGDLIEMTDEFEIGGSEDDEEERGRGYLAQTVNQETGSGSGRDYFGGTVVTARTSGGGGRKSGKND
jgi:LysM repeat protein